MSGATERAASILRNSGGGPMRAAYLMACLAFEHEAVAEWIERRPEDPRAVSAAADVCRAEDMLHEAYLRHAAESP